MQKEHESKYRVIKVLKFPHRKPVPGYKTSYINFMFDPSSEFFSQLWCSVPNRQIETRLTFYYTKSFRDNFNRI